MTLQRDILNLASIRLDLHSIPELGLKEFKTADYLADILSKLGLAVTRQGGGTGLVASLIRGGSDRGIGLRTDMDGLPISEAILKRYTSCHENRMHACGHDGHMAMLVGAAHSLATIPASKEQCILFSSRPRKSSGGAKLMIDDGLFERFPCDMVFALHNMPGLPVGRFTSCDGPIAASIDVATITITGKGGHGAQPDKTIDPIVIGAQIVSAFQTVVSRNLGPFAPAVVTVGAFHSGSASNIIPDKATLAMSLRATKQKDRGLMIDRLVELATCIARGFGGTAQFEWQTGYPATVNDSKAFTIAQEAAKSVSSPGNFEWLENPMMGSEDFSFMLQCVPGALMLIGNGDSPSLHTAEYDFNDAVLPLGVQYFSNIIRIISDR